tara:strand:+ start:3353 stop:3598 length:246 start_codon:yes stop_codon:yes gene_type:complete
MRIVGNIPHDVFTITVFSMNDRYLIKLEAGPMEQTYKLSAENFKSLEEIKTFLDEAFLDEARNLHNEMFKNLKAGLERYRQ